jgi:hypothetical protein
MGVGMNWLDLVPPTTILYFDPCITSSYTLEVVVWSNTHVSIITGFQKIDVHYMTELSSKLKWYGLGKVPAINVRLMSNKAGETMTLPSNKRLARLHRQCRDCIHLNMDGPLHSILSVDIQIIAKSQWGIFRTQGKKPPEVFLKSSAIPTQIVVHPRHVHFLCLYHLSLLSQCLWLQKHAP